MKILYIIMSVLLISFVSCKQNKQIQIELTNLTFSPIKLPLKCHAKMQMRDTVLDDYFNKNYKMIIYTDQESCSGCVFGKMSMWQKLIDYSLVHDNFIAFYFIFSTSSYDSFIKMSNLNSLEHPIIIDTIGEFERLNPHLPTNKAMHTFLLDEDNNVILVGNPLQNKEIEKMFYEEVEKRVK